VAERSREIGIRLALGGEVRRVWVTVAWSSARAVAVGAAVGVGLALAATRGLAAVMPEISGTAWPAGLAAAAWLLATGAAAAMIAARGVLRVEPASALRAP
jgi:ABC-type antimicrobial peptide transport system permease subunit